MSLVITMSSEFPRLHVIAAIHRNGNRPDTLLDPESSEQLATSGTADELFKYPLRHCETVDIATLAERFGPCC